MSECFWELCEYIHNTFYIFTDDTSIQSLGGMKLEKIIYQLEKWNITITLPSTTAEYQGHWQVHPVIFFAKINIWTWKLIWSHQEFSWRSTRIFFPKLTWISGSFFFSHFVCPRCPRDLLVSQKQYIEKECVVYPDTLTSFNPSKLTSFWLLSEWPILPRPFRHLFRSQMMFILFNSIHSSIDLFLFIGCSCRTRHSLNCFHVTICKGKNRCFSLKYYKKEI